MQSHKKISILGLALATAAVALPGQVAAQDPAQDPAQFPTQQQQCQAQVSPAQVAAGERAAEVRITVSEPIGEVTGLQAGASGIQLAAAEDLPRTPLAADDAPQPIRMGDAENQWVVYLNTTGAQAGQHELTFELASGTCTGQVTVGN
jgi:hypothetical protein